MNHIVTKRVKYARRLLCQGSADSISRIKRLHHRKHRRHVNQSISQGVYENLTKSSHLLTERDCI